MSTDASAPRTGAVVIPIAEPATEQRRAASVPARGRRYDARVMRRAREHARAGWNRAQIALLLADEFAVYPSPTTIDYWTRPDVARKGRARTARRNTRLLAATRTGGLGSPHHTDAMRLDRMRALHQRGLSYRAVGQVMELDYGHPLSGDQVRRALATGRYPRRCAPAGG
jgi:hypothetical protein